MVFSSLTFIYFFLPILLFVYFIIPNKFKSIVLVLFSLVFYFYGEGKYILVLLLSSIINYYLSKKITNNLLHRPVKQMEIYCLVTVECRSAKIR